jgi:colanic acid biosynthesis protein WcaH
MACSQSQTSDGKYLTPAEYKKAIDLLPIIAIDFLLTPDPEGGNSWVLLGRRKNSPAKNFWFTPGGRIRKGESIPVAMKRIFRDEFGISLTEDIADKPNLVGLFDHFYDEGPLEANLPSHYVDILYSISLKVSPRDFLKKIELYNSQHHEWAWVSSSICGQRNKLHPNAAEMICFFKKINDQLDSQRKPDAGSIGYT